MVARVGVQGGTMFTLLFDEIKPVDGVIEAGLIRDIIHYEYTVSTYNNEGLHNQRTQ